MTDLLVDGLTLSLYGITLVFAALLIIVFLILVLQWVSRLTEARPAVGPQTQAPPPRPDEMLARVAAIAVVMARAQADQAQEGTLGHLLQTEAFTPWGSSRTTSPPPSITGARVGP